jgi:hypothetical protein
VFTQDALSRANQLDPPADEQKKKKRRLRRVSSLDRDVGPSVPAAEEVPVPEFTVIYSGLTFIPYELLSARSSVLPIRHWWTGWLVS